MQNPVPELIDCAFRWKAIVEFTTVNYSETIAVKNTAYLESTRKTIDVIWDCFEADRAVRVIR
jgi:hypothetical protein